MTTRELLHAHIDRLDEQSLTAVYQLVRQYPSSRDESRSGGLLSKLKEIQIDAPADFSINLDHYLYGDGSAEEDIR